MGTGNAPARCHGDHIDATTARRYTMRQSIYLLGTGLFGLGVVTCGSSAQAQEQPYFQQPVPAPSNAFELKVGTGYTQGFGNISPGRALANVAGAGIGVTADLPYPAPPTPPICIQ